MHFYNVALIPNIYPTECSVFMFHVYPRGISSGTKLRVCIGYSSLNVPKAQHCSQLKSLKDSKHKTTFSSDVFIYKESCFFHGIYIRELFRRQVLTIVVSVPGLKLSLLLAL